MKMPKKETVAMIALMVLVSMLNGKAGARILSGAVREYIRKKQGRGGAVPAVNEATLRVVMSRLHRDGLLKNETRGIWRITDIGRKMIAAFVEHTNQIIIKDINAPIIIVFDVPEKDRGKRNNLRFQLLAMEFTPLQKSVWFGYGPIPEEFLRYLNDRNLLEAVHIFSIQKQGTLSDIFSKK